MSNSESLSLKFGLLFDDLYRREGLVRIDAAFLDHLRAVDLGLFNRMMDARAKTGARKQLSELMVELAPVYALKRKFIQKKAISGVTPEKASAINGRAVGMELEALLNEPLTEASFVDHVSRWLEDEANHATELAVAAQYGAWAALSPAGRREHDGGVLFKVPHKLDT